MESYKHLLVATDFADDSADVEKRALGMRELFGCRLSLVHVVEYLPAAYSADLTLPEDFSLEQELLDAARNRMTTAGERLGVAEADRHVLVGTPGREIPNIVEREAVDLIVVGSHARHGLSALFGSTANAILHHADCDVLAVRVGR